MFGIIFAVLAALMCQAEVINVKEFGAVGDGKADDTSAIPKAMEEGKGKGLPVYFPRGVYQVTKPLVLEGPLGSPGYASHP